MLPSRERLTRSSLFQRAYTARKSITTPLFTLYVVPRIKQAGGAKRGGAALKHSENGAEMPVKAKSVARMPLVGFVVAKKVCKSACVRNRTKRRIREAYRLWRHTREADDMELSQWYALAWVVHDKALCASWQEIKQTVTECLRKANVRYGLGARPAKIEPQRGEPQS